jgi:hypothetical protein
MDFSKEGEEECVLSRNRKIVTSPLYRNTSLKIERPSYGIWVQSTYSETTSSGCISTLEETPGQS